MIHHSRNTAQKQWAETKVLTISGVVRVFNTKRNLLKSMGDYSKSWVLLLEYVEKMALSDTSEVSLAALKALQEMITSSSTISPHKEPPKGIKIYVIQFLSHFVSFCVKYFVKKLNIEVLFFLLLSALFSN